MDPRLAQVLQALSESTPAVSLQQAPQFPPGLAQQQQGHGQYQASNIHHDPRRQIYQPDLPPAPRPPPASFSTPSPPVQRIDPKTITDWPAALKYITLYVARDENVMTRLRKMKAHQQEHEKGWWEIREGIIKKHSNSANNRLAMDSILKSFSVSTNSSELTPEQKRLELENFDTKVHKQSMKMYDDMITDLGKLGIPFFVISEKEFSGDKATFYDIRRKVVELIEDLT